MVLQGQTLVQSDIIFVGWAVPTTNGLYPLYLVGTAHPTTRNLQFSIYISPN